MLMSSVTSLIDEFVDNIDEALELVQLIREHHIELDKVMNNG